MLFGYKVNVCTNVNSDKFLSLPISAKMLWLYLFHEIDPLEDEGKIFAHPLALCRMLGIPDEAVTVTMLVDIHALIPVTDDGVTVTLRSNGGVTL